MDGEWLTGAASMGMRVPRDGGRHGTRQHMVHRAGIECAGSAGVGFPDGEGESRVSGSGCQGG